MTSTVPELLDKLATHGHPAQIADHLVDLGVAGYPRTRTLCAIAAYLRQAHPALAGVQVYTDSGIVTWTYRNVPCTRRSSARLPDALHTLAIQFDQGLHPRLQWGWHAAVDEPVA